MVTESGRASISGVQRRLKIGYNRAASMSSRWRRPEWSGRCSRTDRGRCWPSPHRSDALLPRNRRSSADRRPDDARGSARGGVPGAAAGDGAEARIDGWLAANESLRARFTQTVFDEGGFRLNESHGTVAFRRPYRFRWNYEAPEPQIIVADGERLWWYDIDLQQVTVRPVDAALEGTPASLLAGRTAAPAGTSGSRPSSPSEASTGSSSFRAARTPRSARSGSACRERSCAQSRWRTGSVRPPGSISSTSNTARPGRRAVPIRAPPGADVVRGD